MFDKQSSGHPKIMHLALILSWKGTNEVDETEKISNRLNLLQHQKTQILHTTFPKHDVN